MRSELNKRNRSHIGRSAGNAALFEKPLGIEDNAVGWTRS